MRIEPIASEIGPNQVRDNFFAKTRNFVTFFIKILIKALTTYLSTERYELCSDSDLRHQIR